MVDMEKMAMHIREHVKFPATKTQIMEACGRMMDIPDEDVEWFEESLPEGKYKNPQQVMKALGL